MTMLAQLLEGLSVSELVDFRDLPVAQAACHPDKAGAPDTLFVCMDEYLEYNRWQTWRTHLEWVGKADSLAAVIAPARIPGLQVPQIVVDNPRHALAHVCSAIAGHPARQLEVHGVTGTNGKTTTVHMIAHALDRLGCPCGNIGTLGAKMADKLYPSDSYTTPLSPAIQRHLAGFLNDGAQAAAMEVSSHALALQRTDCIEFSSAVLTNIGRDHLDFHGTQEAYVDAKRQLFRQLKRKGVAVLNADCAHGSAFAQEVPGEVFTFSANGNNADLMLHDIAGSPQGTRGRLTFRGESFQLKSLLLGRFQMENLLAALGVLFAKGIAAADALRALEDFQSVTGRMQRIDLPNKAVGIVDYAHNPDGLRSLLENCRPVCNGSIHLIFGCGGDRDRGKRPLMGAIAAELADSCWVTSDNPRTEDPHAIIRDVLAGMGSCANLHVEEDRRSAILAAYAATRAGDLLVVAGKGHEDYQIIGHTKHPFSDAAILADLAG